MSFITLHINVQQWKYSPHNRDMLGKKNQVWSLAVVKSVGFVNRNGHKESKSMMVHILKIIVHTKSLEDEIRVTTRLPNFRAQRGVKIDFYTLRAAWWFRLLKCENLLLFLVLELKTAHL